MLLICMLISSPVFATKPDAPNKPEMNIFELGIRPDRDNDFADVARQTISASVDHEAGTLAMYALQRSDNSGQAFMFELYENERAYRKHLNAAPYKAFAARAPDIIDRKKKITLEPQFLGDKHIIPNERTINNLVIVEVKPEFQSEFPTHGAIARATFNAQIGGKVLMTLKYGNKSVPFGAIVTHGENKNGSIVAENGQVYLTGLPPSGKLQVSWGKDKNSNCIVEYKLPEVSPGTLLNQQTAICR